MVPLATAADAAGTGSQVSHTNTQYYARGYHVGRRAGATGLLGREAHAEPEAHGGGGVHDGSGIGVHNGGGYGGGVVGEEGVG